MWRRKEFVRVQETDKQTTGEEQIKTSNAGNLVSALLEIAWIQLDKNVIELSVSGDFQWVTHEQLSCENGCQLMQG